MRHRINEAGEVRMLLTSKMCRTKTEAFNDTVHQGHSSTGHQWLISILDRFSVSYIFALFRKLNRRLVVVIAISGLLVVSVLHFASPYPLFGTGSPSDVSTDAKSELPLTHEIAGTQSKAEETPSPPEYCTTWPVDKDGNYNGTSPSKHTKLQLDTLAPPGGWKKPPGVKVVAMIFYGRRRAVDILDCYLQQNLVSNGGYLDEVWFMIHTEVKEDLDWLHEKVEQEQAYKFKDFRDTCNQYGCLWDYATEDNTIYLKIDDDMVSLGYNTATSAANFAIDIYPSRCDTSASPHTYS
jgi:hypothetical protein